MQRTAQVLRFLTFFFSGALLASIVLASSGYLLFSFMFKNKIYPGVKVDGRIVSGQDKIKLANNFTSHYQDQLDNLTFSFTSPQATISAKGKDLNLRVDSDLITQRVYSVGRQSTNPYYNFLQIIAAWNGQIDLPIEISFDRDYIDTQADQIAPLIEKIPVDAIYMFVPGAGPDGRGRVTAFRPSENGLIIDREKIKNNITALAKKSSQFSSWQIPLPIITVSPLVKSTTADELGIQHLIGRGESYFYDSIPGRVYNIGLGTEKIGGSLIAPNEVFSFDQAIGTVSGVFGFQKAYAIIKGKTVLDDGGGVCQVSTTLYRAVLNAGLPIIERVAHSYRVGFYEQGGFLPGMDATVYPPSPDLKFLNDTGNWILIQANFDEANHKLTFDLFGKGDGRKVIVSKPVFISTSPPPEPVYEDDPSLPAGEVKQVDTAHSGAKVYFKRLVTLDDQVLINETVYSDYIPWPARYLKGTKTN